MGFSTIINLIKEALGIIIIVAAVILFSYFDPFGWFDPKPKIQESAILLREVRAIGQLITAEYYGEALTSWPKVFEESAFQEDSTDIQRILTGINSELDDGDPLEKDDKGRPKDWSDKEMWKYYKKNVRAHYENSDLYELIIKEAVKGISTNMFNKEKKAIQAIYAKSGESGGEIFSAPQILSISKGRKKNSTGTAKRKDAVCIGRGIVRAGIDLSKVKEDDITIFDFSQTAYISNVTLQIIAVELNPWFIPQKKVKGFEILKLKGRIDGGDISLLKAKCKEQIEQQANDRKILDEARRNAEDALLSFFNLIRKEPLKHVRIITDTLETLKIKFDSLKYLTPQQSVEIYNKAFLYINNRGPYDSLEFLTEKASLQLLLERMRKKTIQFEVSNKDPKSRELKVAHIPLDAYNIKALQQHFKIPLTSDTLSDKKLKLKEKDYLNAYWLDKPDSTNAFEATLSNRIQEIEELVKNGM